MSAFSQLDTFYAVNIVVYCIYSIATVLKAIDVLGAILVLGLFLCYNIIVYIIINTNID